MIFPAYPVTFRKNRKKTDYFPGFVSTLYAHPFVLGRFGPTRQQVSFPPCTHIRRCSCEQEGVYSGCRAAASSWTAGNLTYPLVSPGRTEKERFFYVLAKEKNPVWLQEKNKKNDVKAFSARLSQAKLQARPDVFRGLCRAQPEQDTAAFFFIPGPLRSARPSTNKENDLTFFYIHIFIHIRPDTAF